MIRCISCILALASVVLIGSIRGDDKAPANTVRAQRTLRIKSNDEQERIHAAADIREMAQELSNKRMMSSNYDVMQSAADAVGIAPEQMLRMVTLNYDPLEQTASVVIDLKDAPPATKMCATEAANRVVEMLGRVLDSQKPHSDFEGAQYATELMQKRKEECRDRIKFYQQQLTDQTGAVDVSPATLRQLLSSLQTQRESIQIDLQAKMERRNSLAAQISKFSKEIEDKIKDDPIAAELEKVVQVREVDLKRKQDNPQAYSKTEVEEAIGPVAEAKAKLLERRELAIANAGGDIITGWNKELMNLSVDLDELKARSAIIEDRLHRFAGTGDLIRELDEAESSIAEQNRQLTEMSRHVAEMEMEFRRHHVWLEVVSSKDEPAPATQPSH